MAAGEGGETVVLGPGNLAGALADCICETVRNTTPPVTVTCNKPALLCTERCLQLCRREAAEPMALLDAIIDGLVRYLHRQTPVSKAASSTCHADIRCCSAARMPTCPDVQVDDSDGGLRQLCAKLAREWLIWSGKHISGPRGAALNASSLLRRLFDRLQHPDAYQR